MRVVLAKERRNPGKHRYPDDFAATKDGPRCTLPLPDTTRPTATAFASIQKTSPALTITSIAA